MKPIIILPPGELSEADIQLLRENELCVVVAKNPAAVKFVDPIPCASNRTQIEAAAIQFSRRMLAGEHPQSGHVWNEDVRHKFAMMFVNILVNGTALQSGPTDEERLAETRRHAKFDEAARLGREDARKEREAKKKEAQKAKKVEPKP